MTPQEIQKMSTLEKNDIVIKDVAKSIIAVFMHPSEPRYEEVLEATIDRITNMIGDYRADIKLDVGHITHSHLWD